MWRFALRLPRNLSEFLTTNTLSNGIAAAG